MVPRWWGSETNFGIKEVNLIENDHVGGWSPVFWFVVRSNAKPARPLISVSLAES